MISSLCPLPIGTIASMALIQVSRGTLTDFLEITPGATFSTSQKCFGMIGAHSSTGCPSPSSTLQRYSSPTPTWKICPVARTVSPCSRLLGSPRINTPTHSEERSSTSPLSPFWKVTISENITLSSQTTVATPSLSSTISPFLEKSTSRFAPLIQVSICLRSSCTIDIVLYILE